MRASYRFRSEIGQAAGEYGATNRLFLEKPELAGRLGQQTVSGAAYSIEHGIGRVRLQALSQA